MRILLVCGFSPYWGTVPTNVLDLDEGPTVGGGEENLLQCAKGLKALGHHVEVYWYGMPGTWAGVPFHNLAAPLYPRIVGEQWDVVASWSSLRALEYAPKGAKRLFVQQLNDLSSVGDWSRVDCIVSPSRNHAEQVHTWPIPSGTGGWTLGWNGPRAVVHNGLNPDQYRVLPPWHERPMNVGYWSSPDRGLHHVLTAWPTVLRLEPKAKLHVFYEIERMLAMALALPFGPYGHRAMVLRRLVGEAKADPSITFHGAVPRRKLVHTQKQCRVQAYPYEPFAYCEGFCHPPGTLVTTIEGMKPVEKLSLADKVLGHSGAWREVHTLRVRPYQGTLIKVLPACGEAVEMTGDHPVLATKDPLVPFSWLPAEDVEPGMWVFTASPTPAATVLAHVPTPKKQLFSVEQHASQIQSAKTLGGKAPVVLPDVLPVTADLCRLVGYFAGDGNAATRGRAAGTLSFFFGTEQKEANVVDLQDCIQRVFGTTSEVKDHRPAKKMVAVRIFSSSVSGVFSSWCYAPDGKKKLPEWVMSLPADLIEEVLKGLWRTDGSVVQMGSARFAGFTSSSPYLIDQVRTLLKTTGRTVRMQRRVHPNGNTSWSIYFSIADRFLDYPSQRVNETLGTTFTREVPGGRALKVREVEARQYTGLVYSLSVSADESYHVGNFVVHNCGSINQGLAAGCEVLTTPKDALPTLYGDGPFWLDENTLKPGFHQYLAETIVQGLHGKLPGFEKRRTLGPETAAAYSWWNSAKQMEAACLGTNWF